jgi:hypothetical protein
MEKFLLKLSTLIPHDKLLHSHYGDLIFATLLLLFSIGNIFNIVSFTILVIIVYTLTVIAAVSKEVYDFFNKSKHTPDYTDIIYTVLKPTIITIAIIIGC